MSVKPAAGTRDARRVYDALRERAAMVVGFAGGLRGGVRAGRRGIDDRRRRQRRGRDELRERRRGPVNLIAHATFEEGMDGLAPLGWQVRDPALPTGSCLSSGTPDQHVYLSPGPPACSGSAIPLDARGQWDCDAIQGSSAYNTIEGGLAYRISAAVRAQGNAVNPAAWFVIGAQWLDANDAVFGYVKNPKPASASMNDFDWQVLSFDVVAPAGVKRIVVWRSSHYPGRVDDDDVSVVQLGP